MLYNADESLKKDHCRYDHSQLPGADTVKRGVAWQAALDGNDEISAEYERPPDVSLLAT